MRKNKGLLLVVVGLVAILGFWLVDRGNKPAVDTESGSEVSEENGSSDSVASAPRRPGATSEPSGPTKSYTEYVQEYEGRRIQFDEKCQAVPNDVTFKQGTWVMLDNRSSEPRTIQVGDRSFELQGYGYWVTQLSSSVVPSELTVKCGSAGNVGKILLQAKLL